MVFPGILIKCLALALTWIKLACICLFCMYIIYSGIGYIFAVAITCSALNILWFTVTTHAYSSYPFLMPSLLIFIQLLGSALSTYWSGRYFWSFSIVFISGIVGVFIWNVRTSYLPIVLALFMLYVFFIFLNMLNCNVKLTLKNALLLFCTIFLFFAGASVCYLSIFYPINILAKQGNFQNSPRLQSHPLFHPLVLALAVPENDLSKREGIEWDDIRGFQIARRVNSQCQYLSPQYEKALSDYYFGLWEKSPQEV